MTWRPLARKGTMTTLRTTFARARGESGDEGMAIAIVLMMILIITSLSLLTLGLVLSQVKPTANAANRVQALQTAESGIQTMVNDIRTAGGTDTAGSSGGDRWAELPCGTKTGEVAVPNKLHYSVAVTYYDTDPSGVTRADLADHLVRCGSNRSQYALIESRALDAGGGLVKVDQETGSCSRCTRCGPPTPSRAPGVSSGLTPT